MSNFFNHLFTKNSKLSTEQLIVKKTVVSFFFFFLLMTTAVMGWKWLRQQQPNDHGTRTQLRKALNTNEAIFEKLLPNKKLAKEYSLAEAEKKVRVNGKLGLHSKLDSSNWQMNVVKKNGDTLRLKLEDIKKLPKTEIIFNFKCIEGWNQITYWGGVKFSDFIKAYGLSNEASLKYIGLSTPDKEYYVGIDMPSAM
ncbi:MAG: molybdopterin-dependent oxidoreductase, partial [Bacteroidota bacterium]